MEYRDITALFQLFLDLETSRSRNVLQVDAAKALGDQGNGVDDGIYIFGIHTQRERVHTGKLFEQGTFALITGMSADGPISPSPRTAVPSVITATRLPLRV